MISSKYSPPMATASHFGKNSKALKLETMAPLPAQETLVPTQKVNKRRWPWVLLFLSLGGGIASEWNLQKTAAWLQSARFSEPDNIAKNRRNALAKTLQKIIQDQPIDWPLFADCIERIAEDSPNNEVFRRDVAYFFGENAFFQKQLDKNNGGLKSEFCNTGYTAEQFHHYIGGTTGETWLGILPTHLYNCPLGSCLNEIAEYLKSKDPHKKINTGDIRLFEAARKHRDDFLKYGRHTVAPNIRQLCP